MKKAERLFLGVGIIAVVAVIGGAIWQHWYANSSNKQYEYPTTQFGAFLATQHAVYVNDFDSATEYAGQLTDTEYPIVQSVKFLSDYLAGTMPDGIEILEEEKTTASRLIYETHLAQQGDWDELYKRHKTNDSALAAPLRIWPGVALGKQKDIIKFIQDLPTNESWKHFVIGQIYAHDGDADQAREHFEQVSIDFMNINDYLYIMSFYAHNDMTDASKKLHDDFTSRPGGMFMLDYNTVPDWSMFSGINNQLAFSLVQTVSHTQIMMYSDLAMLLLRFAELSAPDFAKNNDAINYYTGQYFYTNGGDYSKYFSKIDSDSPFYMFAMLRVAEQDESIDILRNAREKNPLFVPAINKQIAYHIKHGDKRDALRVINMALGDENLDELGYAFFLKSRAHIYYMFEEYEDAQRDLHDAAKVLPLDAEILSLQAKLWAVQGRNIEDAYDYAMTLIRQDPTSIMAWDTLGVVIAVREGAQPALDVLVRVGEVANSQSSLFEHLGDLYVAIGDEKLARDAYLRAIELSDDGLTVVPKIQKKLKDIK